MIMVETVVSALLVSIICMLSWLAYNYHDVYLRISTKLSTYAFSVVLAIVAYCLGAYKSVSDLSPSLSQSNAQAGTKLTSDLLSVLLVSVGLYFAFIVYLSLLDNIHQILENKDDKKPKSK